MDINAEAVIDDLLNQIKQLTLQNSILRATITELRTAEAVQSGNEQAE
jgi:hypothetical protein